MGSSAIQIIETVSIILHIASNATLTQIKMHCYLLRSTTIEASAFMTNAVSAIMGTVM